ncbi:helix-turn-helix transcriptional regulator [Lysobacter sp. D1-1-M9]|uniref:helix-turn-helix transcriptional regulator n=1 Tax=Novilysobacter longmucuonensis TaxID=3098603 RepID=UPI002FCC766A
MSSRIRRARGMANLTQTSLALRVGVKRSAVAQWECTAGTAPSTRHLAQVAVATNVCFDWLATGRGQHCHQGDKFDLAVTVHDFAQNEQESRVLELIRRLSPKKQETACAILELLSK